jgi:hypothetical protein
MILSTKTLAILKNFSSINTGILFREGNMLSTVSPMKNILADALIEETIPQEFAIYDLNYFISVISLYKDGAELDFDPNHVIIKGMGGRSRIKYRFTDRSMIVVAPDKRPVLPTEDVKFHFSEENFNWILRTANVLDSPNIAVRSDGEEVNLVTYDVNDDSVNSNYTSLPEVIPEGKKYNLVFKTENLKMLPGSYDVIISSRGIAKFVGTNNNLTYFATLETSSSYE